jgi:hypothetical protein
LANLQQKVPIQLFELSDLSGVLNMNANDLVTKLQTSTQHKYVYHFSDRENIASIKQHGILSKKRMQELGISASKPGGNSWSWEADSFKGISSYVNVCLTTSHPMRHLALQEGRIVDAPYIAIKPEILLLPGVKIALDVANKKGVTIHDLNNAIDLMDLEVLYNRTDWKVSTIRQRLKSVEKYEVLIPNEIPPNFLLGLMKV